MPRKLKPCGTEAAWQRHKKNGEEPCDPCKDGRRTAERERTAQRAKRRQRIAAAEMAAEAAQPPAPAQQLLTIRERAIFAQHQRGELSLG